MRAWPECLSCLLANAVNLSRQVSDDEYVVKTVAEATLCLAPFKGEAWEAFTAVTTMETWRELVNIVGDQDPLAGKKRGQNEAALRILPQARGHVAASPDPLASALKLCILGNVLDTMVGPLTDPEIEMLGELEAQELDASSLHEFRQRLEAATTIAYFGDNCGECVFDLLFIETLKLQRDVDIVYVARETPTINDVTVKEALEIGLDSVARVIGNGNPDPLPSTDLNRCSEEIRELIRSADLIISKGGANYELLSEREEPAGRITFLVHGKCRPLCAVHGVPRGGLIVSNG